MRIGEKVLCSWISDDDLKAQRSLQIGKEYVVSGLENIDDADAIVLSQKIQLEGVFGEWDESYFDLVDEPII